MIGGNELRLGMGLLAVGVIYAGVLYSRRWQGKPPLLADLLAFRLHYAVVGLLLNTTAPEGVRRSLAVGVDIGTVFLAGIFGLIVGCSFDLRLLKRLTKPLLWLECGHMILLVIGVWLLTYGFFQSILAGIAGGGAVLWVVCGLGAAGWVRQSRVGVGRGQSRGVGWFPSVSAMAGLLLAGIGLLQLRSGGFVIRQPLTSTQIIIVEGLWEEILWCVVLGGVVGLIVDLSIREVRRGHLHYCIGAGLLMGCGIAQVLGLEPLWVGAIAGIWLINATLRRLDLLKVLEQGQGLVRTILLGIMGWWLGGALRGGFDLAFAVWILVVLVVAVPVARLGIWHGMGRLLDRSVLRRSAIEPKQLLEFDDLALVVGLGLATVLPSGQAAALLAAVLMGQWLLHLLAVLAADKLSRLNG